MKRCLLLAFLLLGGAVAVGQAAPRPLPIRCVSRTQVDPFPGGGTVPAHRLRSGEPGTETKADDVKLDRATEAGPGVQRVLGEVGDDPYAAYRWVRDWVEYEPYHGVKRGADGVAWERVGSDFDQSALLASLLRSQGIACRFVYGVVRVEAKNFADWYGVANEELAYQLAVQGGTAVRAIRVGGRSRWWS